MLRYENTQAVLRSLGIDPTTVLESGHDESGYLVVGRHPDGWGLPHAANEPEMSRVPWPSPDGWARFQEAVALDTAPEPPTFHVAPEREGPGAGLTGFYVRAVGTGGRWGSYDMAQLDRESLIAFIRSRGSVSTWAVHLILGMLGHDREDVKDGDES